MLLKSAVSGHGRTLRYPEKQDIGVALTGSRFRYAASVASGWRAFGSCGLLQINFYTTMKKVLGNLTEMLADEEKAKEIGLENALDLEMVWVDSTCLKANIHFPVDWVLLKDASRSLIQSIVVIRKHGLMHRILDPKVYKKN